MRLSACAALALALALPALARAGEPQQKVDRSMVVLDFAAQSPADAASAQSVTALVTARLQQHPGARLVTSSDVRSVLGVEKQKQLLGCTDESCIAELGGALGARYIVSGQLDRLGQKFLLGASLVDARTARSLAKVARPVDDADGLAPAASALADQLADAAGLEPLEQPLDADRGFTLGLKLGNTVPILTGKQQVSLDTFNLRLNLELGYFATRQLEPFLGASLALAHGDGGGSLQFVPVLLGAKYYFRSGHALQPYLGGGLGLGFLAGKLTGAQGTSTSFALTGIGGLAYFPWRHVGFNLEGSANLSGVNLSSTGGLLLAYNADFGAIFLF